MHFSLFHRSLQTTTGAKRNYNIIQTGKPPHNMFPTDLLFYTGHWNGLIPFKIENFFRNKRVSKMRHCLVVLIVVVIGDVCTCQGKSDDNEISQIRHQIERAQIVDSNVLEGLQEKKGNGIAFDWVDVVIFIKRSNDPTDI